MDLPLVQVFTSSPPVGKQKEATPGETWQVSYCFVSVLYILPRTPLNQKLIISFVYAPLQKQIIKSPQSAQLIIMIITLSLLVERQILE